MRRKQQNGAKIKGENHQLVGKKSNVQKVLGLYENLKQVFANWKKNISDHVNGLSKNNDNWGQKVLVEAKAKMDELLREKDAEIAHLRKENQELKQRFIVNPQPNRPNVQPQPQLPEEQKVDVSNMRESKVISHWKSKLESDVPIPWMILNLGLIIEWKEVDNCYIMKKDILLQ